MRRSVILGLAMCVAATACNTGADRSTTPTGGTTAGSTAPAATTPGTVPAPRGLVSLLRALPPLDPAGKHSVMLVDVELARRSWHLAPLAADATASSWRDRSNELFAGTVGLDPVNRAFPACTTCSASSDYGSYVAGVRREFGYAEEDIGAVVAVEPLSIVLGTFDPNAVEQAARRRLTGAASTNYDGVAILDVDCETVPKDARLAACGANPSHVVRAFLADRLIQAASIESVHAAIDVAHGKGSSAADDPVMRSVFAALDEEHAYLGMFLDSWRTNCDTPDAGGTTLKCVNERLFDDGTRGAYGYTRDDAHADGSVLFALHNPDPTAADRAGATLTAWYEQGKSNVNGEPYSENYESPIVRVEASIAVVSVPLRSGRGGFRVFQRQVGLRDFPAW